MFVLIKAPDGDFLDGIIVVGKYETEGDAEFAMLADAGWRSNEFEHVYRSCDGFLRTYSGDSSATEWVVLKA